MLLLYMQFYGIVGAEAQDRENEKLKKSK